MKYTKKLKEYYDTFEAYADLDICEFDMEVDEFNQFCNEFSEFFTEEEDFLYDLAYDMMDVGAVYFAAISHEEQMEMEREERAYLTSEWNH
jgi:hypothetical protein